MDLKELVTFRTIVQEGTFSRAAAKLNYAQSTVTSQVKRLEQELGLQLFKRGWDAELTEAGRRYADEVDRLIAHWQYAAEQAKALREEEIGELRIGLIESLADDVMPAAMQAFSALKLRMSVHFTIGSTDALAREIRGQTIQAAICGQPDAVEGLRFRPLCSERASFIATDDHPLAAAVGGSGEVPVSALFDYPAFSAAKPVYTICTSNGP
ncbi:LysR family transcriptional regulator [Paenibacillus sacheonensis]|uniref:LysR family transcriptional regulator n=1 Tax=Paenibacillus sacheonensis TaxID=742054 RepID=UPI001EF773F1|nr:LysR family transcriptional regulator [Paenibacillus sacheonensis]MBM7563919.1 DNA-binding transcriptional LysR family regulator [Paenibacillus sacheonensis]